MVNEQAKGTGSRELDCLNIALMEKFSAFRVCDAFTVNLSA